ncbi:MAG: 3-dehydroquinate synthase [Spirochaetota bacterium]
MTNGRKKSPGMPTGASGSPAPVKVQVGGERPYPVYLGRGLLARLPGLLEEASSGPAGNGGSFGGGPGKRPDPTLVITDRPVARRYLRPVRTALRRGGHRVRALVLPAGERTKSFRYLERVLRGMVRRGLTRDSVVVALGGGVIGDLAGFAASVYMRGCSCVQVPTTLLAQVDSSVGGKTGINLPEGKNLVGSFSSPLLVAADLDTLRTLPAREICAGFAEVVKYGLIFRERMFWEIEAFLERSVGGRRVLAEALLGEPDLLQRLIQASVKTKAEIVTADMREADLRMILNFGHTFGHAVELVTGYRRYLHGEAILLGMEMASELSRALGMLGEQEAKRVARALGRMPLPPVKGIRPAAVLRAMTADKKRRAGEINYILLENIGYARRRTGVPRAELLGSIRTVLERRRGGGPPA